MAEPTVPIIPMAPQYLLARIKDQIPEDLPTMRDPDLLVYFRRDASGLVMGGYERDPAPWGLDGIAGDFNNRLLPEDWSRFEPLSQNAIKRVPALEHSDVIKLINGPEAFTPDNEFVLGESSVRGLFCAAGVCAHGIAGAGGMGQAMAEWIVDGEPSLDLWKMDLRRFGDAYRKRDYTLARTVEVYSTYYDIHYPNEERQAGRPLRLSPTYPRLTALGASFGEKSGWERPNWFEPNAGAFHRPPGWAGHHWSPAIPAEHRVTRERAGLLDATSFAKIELSGRALPGVARDLRRRAWLGALLPHRPRARAVGCPLASGLGVRDGCRRLPRHRLDAVGEGLPRLEHRHHAGGQPLRSRPWIHRAPGQANRLHRQEGADQREGGRRHPAPAPIAARRRECHRARRRARPSFSLPFRGRAGWGQPRA